MSMRMEHSMNVSTKLSHELRMAPHIIQSIEILTLPALELHNFIQEQLAENPVLETIEPIVEETNGSESNKNDEQEPKEEKQMDEESLNSFENLESSDLKEYFSEDTYIAKKTNYSEERDKKFEAMQNTAARPMSLSDYLYQQFQLFDLSEKVEKAGEYIIYNIDAMGYLRYPLEEIIKPIQEEVSIEDAEEALRYVQNLEPTGVGARSMEECLLLQLDEDSPDYASQKLIISKYLTDIYNNKYPKVAKDTGKSIEEIKSIVKSLQKLNPKPGSEYSAEETHVILPDLVVDFIDGDYVIRMEEDYIPQLCVSNLYRSYLEEKNKDRKTKNYIKKKMESANWVIDAIRQRQRTLYRVASEIIKHQRDFLDHGLSHLHPLKMEDVANTLEISVSTVSRAVIEKYIQTARGIFPLRFFFTGGIDKRGSEEKSESRVSVKHRISEIVINEDKSNPLSDEDIAEKLKAVGLDIARRTITKYRKALKIPSSRQRKVY